MRVGNCRDPRTSEYPPPHYVFVGRPSPLGNPFHIGPDGTREEVIEKYRNWLPDAVQSNERVASALRALIDHETHSEHETVLLCFCHPLPCHADVIREFVMAEVEKIAQDMWDAYNSQPSEEDTDGPRNTDRDPEDSEG